MPTGQSHVNIYNKQMVPQQGWDTYFFRYLDDKTNEANRAAFLRSGVLSDKTIGLTSSANDTFSADISLADRGIDGYGHIMDLSLAASVEISNIAFENENAIDYYVGFRFQSVDNAAERNPRTSSAEYPWEMDTIGEHGDPGSVTDHTTYIRLVVDGLTESSIDHGGRLVRVWLKDPVSPVESVAYYYGTVVYGGGINYVDIPYTSSQGPLGQTAPTFPISTTATDYHVLIRGLSWFRGTDISNDANYVYLGTVTGSGTGTTPTVFDITDQYNALLITLQRAYEGSSLDTPAPGRVINATKHAVEIHQSATTAAEQDPFNQAFRIDKREERGVLFSGGVGVMGAPGGFSPLSSVMALYEGAASTLEESEPISLAVGTNRIDFTRGAVDLTQYTSFFNGKNPVIKVSGTTNWNGFYFPDQTSLLAGSIEVFDIGLGTPSFAAESGQANLLLAISNSLFGSPFAAAEEVGFNSINHTLLRGMSGLQMRMFDTPREPRSQFFYRGNVIFNREDNLFWDLFSGRQEMRGGGADYFNTKYNIEDDVTGWAHYKSDKRFDTLEPEFLPTEADTEWGFDYRGSIFAQAQSPAFQLADTHRIPYKMWDPGGGGTEYLNVEEAFTTTTALELQLTRGGDLDVSVIPAFSWYGRGWMWAEVQFDTPQTGDGIYYVDIYNAPDKLTFRDVLGAGPGWAIGQTGVVRFYAGMFSGPYDWANSSDLTTHMMTITSPGQDAGCLRMWCEGNQTIGGGSDKYGLLYFTGFADTSFGFGVRDGGVAFARALTTRDYAVAGSHELIQWDQLDTALLTCDTAQADLAQFTSLDVNEGARVIDITSGTSLDIFEFDGSDLAFIRNQPLFAGKGDVPAAFIYVTAGANEGSLKAVVPGGVVEYFYVVPLLMPEGSDLDTVRLFGVFANADGTNVSTGIKVQRVNKTSPWAGPEGLYSGGWVYALTSATSITVTCNQNNDPVDNVNWLYECVIKTSKSNGGAKNDYYFGVDTTNNVDKFGDNLLKGW